MRLQRGLLAGLVQLVGVAGVAQGGHGVEASDACRMKRLRVDRRAPRDRHLADLGHVVVPRGEQPLQAVVGAAERRRPEARRRPLLAVHGSLTRTGAPAASTAQGGAEMPASTRTRRPMSRSQRVDQARDRGDGPVHLTGVPEGVLVHRLQRRARDGDPAQGPLRSAWSGADSMATIPPSSGLSPVWGSARRGGLATPTAGQGAVRPPSAPAGSTPPGSPGAGRVTGAVGSADAVVGPGVGPGAVPPVLARTRRRRADGELAAR